MLLDDLVDMPRYRRRIRRHVLRVNFGDLQQVFVTRLPVQPLDWRVIGLPGLRRRFAVLQALGLHDAVRARHLAAGDVEQPRPRAMVGRRGGASGEREDGGGKEDEAHGGNPKSYALKKYQLRGGKAMDTM